MNNLLSLVASGMSHKDEAYTTKHYCKALKGHPALALCTCSQKKGKGRRGEGKGREGRSVHHFLRTLAQLLLVKNVEENECKAVQQTT